MEKPKLTWSQAMTIGALAWAQEVQHEVRTMTQEVLERIQQFSWIALRANLGVFAKAFLKYIAPALIPLVLMLVVPSAVGGIVKLLCVPVFIAVARWGYKRFKAACWDKPWIFLAASIAIPVVASFGFRYAIQAFGFKLLLVAIPLTLIRFMWSFGRLTLVLFAETFVLVAVVFNFGFPRVFKCDAQRGVEPLVTGCTITQNHIPWNTMTMSSILGDWLKTLPGFPGNSNVSATFRDISVSSDGKAFWGVAGWSDTQVEKSVAVKIDIATHKVIKAIWIYTPFTVRCSKEFGLCSIVSQMGNRVYLIDDVTNEVVREYDLSGAMPSYQMETGRGEILFLCMPSSGIDRERIAPLGPVEQVRWEDTGASLLLGKLELATGVFTIQPVKGKYDSALMGKETMFASYDPVHEKIMLGATKLGVIDLGSMTYSKVPGSGLTQFLPGNTTAGAVVDTRTGTIYANRPAFGIYSYRYENGVLRVTGKISVDLGGRLLLTDPRRGLVYSANYGRGFVEVIDPTVPSPKPMRWTVGNNIRSLKLDLGESPDEDWLYVASAFGYTRINLSEALGERYLPNVQTASNSDAVIR